MRTFQFRCWDKVSNQYIETRKLYFNGSVSITETWATGDCVIEQFTGLFDKNKKEIYEGDIVKNIRNKHWPVVYKDGSFEVGNEPLCYEFDGDVALFVGSDWCEVVGNIHQNSNLL